MVWVITADQIGSTRGPDLVEAARVDLDAALGPRLLRPADRTAGDELQAATEHPDTALAAVLRLARAGTWSIGLGLGAVELPLAAETRALRGSAFVAARAAVDRAKTRPLRFAVVTADEGAPEIDPLVGLLLALRARRTAEGWELADLLDAGLTQAQAAERLGITPQAASRRALAAQLRLDAESRDALERLLTRAAAVAADARGSET